MQLGLAVDFHPLENGPAGDANLEGKRAGSLGRNDQSHIAADWNRGLRFDADGTVPSGSSATDEHESVNVDLGRRGGIQVAGGLRRGPSPPQVQHHQLSGPFRPTSGSL